MDETVETLMIGVRADTQAFAKDAADMQAALQSSLGSGADRAGTLIESSLLRAIRSGKLGFADLEKTALSVLSEIAAEAVKGGIAALFGGGAPAGGSVGVGVGGSGDGCGCGGGGPLLSLGSGLLGSLLGLPGRATGGPVSPGRPYVVGERGPELFVPTSAGSVAAATQAPARDVRVAISIAAPAGAEPRALAQSGRQVARAVSRALAQAER